MNNVGYVYSGNSSERLNDVLTWHDEGDIRVWIHSKSTKTGREAVSVELQLIGPSTPKPSKEEEGLRLKLCNRRHLPGNASGFKATLFRTLPTGQLLDEHSEIVSRINAQIGQKKNQKIQLVEEITSKSVNLNDGYRWDTESEIRKEGSKSKDAILIAKVYEMLQSSGNRKLSARTAELLGVDVSVVHTAVQVARRNGWLTSNGAGISGGFFTDRGHEMFLAVRGPERLERIMTQIGKDTNGNSKKTR